MIFRAKRILYFLYLLTHNNHCFFRSTYVLKLAIASIISSQMYIRCSIVIDRCIHCTYIVYTSAIIRILLVRPQEKRSDHVIICFRVFAIHLNRSKDRLYNITDELFIYVFINIIAVRTF